MSPKLTRSRARDRRLPATSLSRCSGTRRSMPTSISGCRRRGDVPVGYSSKSGVIFNLVRDDLGKGSDPNSMNYEIAYGRGHWPGEYVVNAMLYRSRDRKYPVGAQIKV